MKRNICSNLMWLLLAVACNSAPERIQNEVPDAKTFQELNAAMAKREKRQIENYLERRGLDMTETGSGLYFHEYQKGRGADINIGDRVEVNLVITLLNGDTCYDYKAYGSELFVVERQSKETGLHEAVKHMKVGSRAKAILPSHLAHGVTGDLNKIPQRSTLIMDIELLGKD